MINKLGSEVVLDFHFVCKVRNKNDRVICPYLYVFAPLGTSFILFSLNMFERVGGSHRTNTVPRGEFETLFR